MKRLKYVGGYRKPTQISGYEKRIKTLIVVVLLILGLIILRLFQLQVIRHKQYSEAAKEQHFGSIELPAQRGEIFVRDRNSGELSKLATNTTLNLLYVDPIIAEDKPAIAQALAPLIFTEEDYEACLEDPRDCSYNIEEERSTSFVASELEFTLDPEQEVAEESGETEEQSPEGEGDPEDAEESPSAENTGEEPEEIVEPEPIFKPYSTMVQEVADQTLSKISRLKVDFVVLKRDADDELMEAVESKGLPGIYVEHDRFLIHGDPTQIPDGQLKFVARQLSPLLEEEKDVLEKQLSIRDVRYVFLKNKLSPEISDQIRELDLKGVVLLPEHWRYYPENALAAHVVGFINNENLGQYGIEGYFNNELKGKSGTIYSQRDQSGRDISVEGGEIVIAEHGEDLVLTIDRVVQDKVEDILSSAVERYRADSGQVIIMDPFTGAIIAMASYPDFNPNEFSESFTLRKVEANENVFPTTPLFKKDERGRYVNVTDEERELKEENPEVDVQWFVYENRLGPGAFRNPIVSDLYEPGSVFKPITMAIALDAGEVKPQDTFNDDGPKKVGDFEIKNSDGKYHGPGTSMTEVLEKSLNTGMVEVAKKLGPKLMYDYLDKFGFGDYAGITLEGETQGKLEYYNDWERSKQFTTAYGQGIVASPLQVVTAWAALANGGKLMQPYIVQSTIKDGKITETEPEVIRRVISEESSSLITSMLISVVKNGHGLKVDTPGYSIAGKTGTSQIASSKGAGYETGEGAVITSFAGYFPTQDPQFVMLVKFDRPRLGADAWGSNTAAPAFRQISDFLIEHYQIQPKQ